MDSTGTDSVGEVLRRLDAEESIFGGKRATPSHACHGIIYGSWSALCDASHSVVVELRRVLELGRSEMPIGVLFTCAVGLGLVCPESQSIDSTV